MVGYQPPATPYVDLPSQTTAIWAADLNNATAAIANLDCRLLPCDVATTASITLSGTGQTIDAVVITAGMRIFNKDDATGTNRGVYVAGSGSWARSADFKAGAVFRSGTTVIVTKGSQANREYSIAPGSGAQTGTVGSDSLTVTWINNTSGGGGGGGYSTVYSGGSTVTQRSNLSFSNGFAVVDDSSGATSGGAPATEVIPPVFMARAATTTFNGTVTTGPQTVDGVSCVAGDRVYYKDSSTPTFNGLYIVQATGVNWIRAPEMQTGVAVPAGSLLSITEGAINGGKEYQLGSSTAGAASMTVGTNAIVLAQISPFNRAAYSTIARDVSRNTYAIPVEGNYIVTIDADNTTVIAQSLYDNVPRVITLVVNQDATGHAFQFSPSHIAWQSGMIGPGNVPFDTSALTQTIVRLTWLGILYGFYGEILNSLDALYWSPGLSTTLTYSGSGGSSGGFGGTSTQTCNMNMYFPRNMPTSSRQMYINGAMKCTSAALRQKLTNNGVTFEVSMYYSAEGPAGMPDRVLDVGAGTSQYLNRGANATPPSACVYPWISGPQSDPYPNPGGIDGQVCHELMHATDANYYTGSNTAHPTYGAIPIRNQPPLWNPADTSATSSGLYQRCVANGGPAGNNNEWFAELMRHVRIGDNGDPNAVPPTGSMAVQLGTGTTSNTPAQRYSDFVTHINSLSLV